MRIYWEVVSGMTPKTVKAVEQDLYGYEITAQKKGKRIELISLSLLDPKREPLELLNQWSRSTRSIKRKITRINTGLASAIDGPDESGSFDVGLDCYR